MREYRCVRCDRLIFKLLPLDIGIEIEPLRGKIAVNQPLEAKCPKCSYKNVFYVGIKNEPEINFIT